MSEIPYEPEDAWSTTLVSDRDELKPTLCPRCQSLDLTVDKFIIGTEPSIIDLSNSSRRYEPQKARENFRVKSGSNWENFSTLKYMSEHLDTCQLCLLLHRTMIRYGNNLPRETSCSLAWEIHGRESRKSGFSKKTRRIRLAWNDPSKNQQEAYLVLVAPHDPQRPNSDASARYQKEKHFLGRGFGDRKEKQALMKSWIDLCVEDHEKCKDNYGTTDAFKNLIRESYFGVIDVVDMQLKWLPKKRDGSPEPYIALSYVWGKQQDFPAMTKRQNIMTHILHGGLETFHFPRQLELSGKSYHERYKMQCYW
ncbi:hypothetical protein PENSTE_c012G03347 [Penicillium steckii]|uniref:Heterokaryon incompatibility domain-containing protein n=1 Tax=Penicillium steckii TaxID=303698 RepID=A0A1V6T5N4_9EURO|nr:hypothetical protein PENSTE_c012G03347 [Penicillium steckii]